MTARTQIASAHAMSWSSGLLTMFIVVFLGTVVPGVIAWQMSASQAVAGAAMLGGFMTCWYAYIAIIRMGARRGWWA